MLINVKNATTKKRRAALHVGSQRAVSAQAWRCVVYGVRVVQDMVVQDMPLHPPAVHVLEGGSKLRGGQEEREVGYIRYNFRR